MRKPRRSKRPISSATRPRRTASGLSRTRVVSVGIALPAVGGSGRRFRTASSCAAAAWARAPRRYGHSRHSGLSAERQREQVSLSRRAQWGQAMKSGSTSPPQPGHMPSSPSLRSIARISSSRSRTSSRYSGGRRIVYTSAPTNGKTSAVTIETPTSTGSSTRRLASLYVQNTSASQSTPTKNSTSSTIAWNVLELKKSETPPSGLSLLSEVAARGRLVGIRIDRSGGGVRVL